MYSRSYYADEQNKLALPENYNGTAFMEKLPEEEAESQITESREEVTVEASARSGGLIGGFGNIPSGFPGSWSCSGKSGRPGSCWGRSAFPPRCSNPKKTSWSTRPPMTIFWVIPPSPSPCYRIPATSATVPGT